MNNKSIPKEVVEITKKLENAGFEAFLVGGCVRDMIIDRKPKDWDITTNANPDQIVSLFPNSFYENTFGTVGIKNEDSIDSLRVVEVTPYRIEGDYSDNRHPNSVIFSQKIEDDLKRRDFTVNSLAYSVSEEKIIDLYNGQKDLKDKIIRTVGEPSSRFTEDGLRIIRAVRFSAELEFEIDAETEKGIIEYGHLLKNISQERIRDEFSKIVMSKNPMYGLLTLRKLGLLSYFLPELEETIGVEQGGTEKSNREGLAF
jgi:tRNA nucleotidyltransferase/poly(A) polymerase